MYFDFETHRTMLRLAWGEPNRVCRRRALFAAVVAIPALYGIHAVAFALDRLCSPALRRTEVTAPIFVIGHARSGTTLMHRLITGDAEHFSFFKTYEMFFPSLLERRGLRALGRLDRALGSPLKRRLIAAQERALADTQDMHATGLFDAEEDDFVLCTSAASGFWIVLFPYMPELDFFYIDGWAERRRARLMAAYRDIVRRQLVLNGVHKTHCSKNPAFSGRVESILETFPDARFVVMVRDPREAIPSLLKMLQKVWGDQGWDRARIDRCLQALAEQSFDMYRQPFEALARHPEVPHAIVDYRDLVADPKATVEEVYGRLGVPITDSARRVLEEQQSQAREHSSSHSYGLEEFGLSEDRLRTELADLWERFRWSTP